MAPQTKQVNVCPRCGRLPSVFTTKGFGPGKVTCTCLHCGYATSFFLTAQTLSSTVILTAWLDAEQKG